MKTIVLCLALSVATLAAQAPPPATTPFTRRQLVQQQPEAFIGYFGAGFNNIYFYEDFEGADTSFATNANWMGPTNYYKFTSLSGHVVEVVPAGGNYTNNPFCYRTNGAFGPCPWPKSGTVGLSKFYMRACVTNMPWEKYFIVGATIKNELMGSYTGFDSNSGGFALHVGASSLRANEYYQLFHNGFLDDFVGSFSIAIETNPAVQLQGSNIVTWSMGSPPYGLPIYYSYTGLPQTYEFGYVGDWGDQKILYMNVNGFQTNLFVNKDSFNLAWGTNVAWQLQNAGATPWHRFSLERIWVRKPGSSLISTNAWSRK